MGSYRLTPIASADIDAIYTDGFRLFGETQADHYHDALHRIFTLLADHPFLARPREEIDGVVRAYPFRSHIIIYDIDDGDDVVILSIRHSHEDWQNDFL